MSFILSFDLRFRQRGWVRPFISIGRLGTRGRRGDRTNTLAGAPALRMLAEACLSFWRRTVDLGPPTTILANAPTNELQSR